MPPGQKYEEPKKEVDFDSWLIVEENTPYHFLLDSVTERELCLC